MDVLGRLLSNIQRATADVAETVGGTLPNIPFGGSDEEQGSQKVESALEKYGPKMNSERKWRRGSARMAAHMPFKFYHRKFDPDAQDSLHESSPTAMSSPSKMGSAMLGLVDANAAAAGMRQQLQTDLLRVSDSLEPVAEIVRRDSDPGAGEFPQTDRDPTDRGTSEFTSFSLTPQCRSAEEGESAEC